MITRTSHLTPGHPDALAHQIRTTHQAHFANTGPFGATCAECIFLGYDRQIRNENGDTVKTVHSRRLQEVLRTHRQSWPRCARTCGSVSVLRTQGGSEHVNGNEIDDQSTQAQEER
jgi:hypothetical protein